MLPFAVSISVLTVLQAATVGLPAPDRLAFLRRLRRPGWALVPALSIVAAVVAIGAAASVAKGLSYLALVGVPPLAAVALARITWFAAPRLAWVVVPLFALAWLDRTGLAGEAGAAVLTALSCVTLGAMLVEVAPRGLLRLGVVAMALVDTGLVVSDLLQKPNGVLNAAHPVAGLPQLQRAVFGSAVIGYGDLFVAGVVGALLATSPLLRRHGVVLTAALGLLFDLLFFAVNTLPATVPVAVALLLADRRTGARRGQRAGVSSPDARAGSTTTAAAHSSG